MEEDHSKSLSESMKLSHYSNLIFKKILQVHINGAEVTCNSSTNFAFKTYFDVMSSFSSGVRKIQASGWGPFCKPKLEEDITAKANKSLGDNKVFDKLHDAITKNGGGVCRSELFIDAFNVHKYHPKRSVMKITQEF